LILKRETPMKRHNILNISTATLLGFAVLSANAAAQQKSLKEQLVGAWTIVSSEITDKNGTNKPDFGSNPKGVLIFDASGKYAQILERPDRPKFKASEDLRRDTPAAEYGAAARGYAAAFGTWSVSEADKILIRLIEGSLIPNAEGREAKASVTLAGSELKLSGTTSNGQKVDQLWKR
jgi:hypothetical protein